MSAWVDRVVLALVLVVPAGCRKAGGTATTMDASAEAGGEAPADPLAELDRLEGRMRELGLKPGSPPATVPAGDALAEDRRVEEAPPPSEAAAGATHPEADEAEPSPQREREDEGGSHCTNVCELSEAICELEVRICGMAGQHGEDPVYGEACERAVDDCELAGDACNTCGE